MSFIVLPLKIIFFSLVIFTLCRFGLYITYIDYFSSLNFREVIHSFIKGIQFDSATTMLCLAPILLILSLPIKWLQQSIVKSVLAWLSLIILIMMLLYCLGNLAYFGEVKRHIGAEILGLSADKSALFELAFSSRLSYTLYGGLLLTIVIFLWYYLIIRSLKCATNIPSSWGLKTLSWLGLILLYLILFRGMILTSRPINLGDAFIGSKLQQAYLALNPIYTSYREIRSRLKQQPLHYVSSQDLYHFSQNNPFIFQRHYPKNVPTKKNVVLILLESWSYKYIDGLSGSKYKVTPFMDSLISKSQVWDNYYAAGQRSIIGVQAILSSLPALPNHTTLGFGLELNKMNKIAEIANQHNYRTIMMQSSARRSFHMDSIANALGFQEYYGKEDIPLLREYPQEQASFGWDYDSLQFFNKKISENSHKPFFAFMFTGTTHEPFAKVGEEFEVYPHDTKNENGFLNTLKYSDWSLKQFMQEAEKQDWYKNTIFIFTADHTLNAGEHSSLPQQFHIPLVIYTPDGSLTPKRDMQLASQYDLFPSIIDLLGFNQPIYAYGKSLFSEEQSEQIMLNKGNLMGMISDKTWLGFTEQGIQIQSRPLTEEDERTYHSLKLKMQYADQLLRENRWIEPNTLGR